MNFVLIIVVAFIIYNIINIFFFSTLLKTFGFYKITRRDFYECGFKPLNQYPIQMPMQIILLSCFFLIYDIELIFIVPFVSMISWWGLLDLLVIFFFFFFFFLSFIADYERHALYWQF